MIIEHEREKLVEVVRFFALRVKHLGKTKLFKLLYFLDFEHYRDTGRSVTGLGYFAWPMGPVPVELQHELSSPQSDWAGKVSFDDITLKDGKRMLAVRASGDFDGTHFTKRELRIMNALAVEYRDSLSDDMVEATHLENLPWHNVYVVQEKKQQSIPYELALRKEEIETIISARTERDSLVSALKG